MATAPHDYQRITLTLDTPWNLYGETLHLWHVKFNLSGSIALNAAEAEATGLDLWIPIQKACATGVNLRGITYYPQGSTVNSFDVEYAAGLHISDGSAWVDATNRMQAEVCVLCSAPVGKNSRGKQVYLRKWIHHVPSKPGDPNSVPTPTGTSFLDKWNTGAGPRLLRPCDPTGGTIGDPWTYHAHLFTHQLRRGPKRKVPASRIVPVPIPVP